MKKQPEKTEQTKFALTMSFWTLYKEKPISKITVKDVTDGAGYYRSTFYFYFSDVYAILELIEDNILEDWNKMTTDVYEQENHENMIQSITAFFEKYGEYMSVLLSPNGDPMFLKKIKDSMRPKMYKLLNISTDDIEASLIFEFIITAMLAFLTEWYHNSNHISSDKAVSLLEALSNENIMSVLLQHSNKTLPIKK